MTTLDPNARTRAPQISQGELDTILAALRLLQMDYDRVLNANASSQLGGICGILEEHNEGLSPNEIDALCERLNCGG